MSRPPTFQIPESIQTALRRCPAFTAVLKLQRPEWWQAQVGAHPGVNFAAELRKAQGWIVANPTRAPKRDVPAFLYRWFQKAAHDAEAAT